VKAIVFYHSDLDGLAANFVMNQHFEGLEHLAMMSNSPEEIQYSSICYNYGDKIPYNKIDKDTTVYFVDAMPTLDEIKEISKICKKLIIVDHHEGQTENVSIVCAMQNEGHCANVQIHFDTTYAGCVLTWLTIGPGSPISHTPPYLELCQDFDLWTKEHGIHTEMMNEFMRSPANGLNMRLWQKLAAMDMDSLKKYLETTDAGLVFSYKFRLAQNYAKHKAVTVRKWGKNIAFGNVVNDIPLTCNEMAYREGVDFALSYFVIAEKVVFSFRSRKDGEDVLPYAKTLGGGGHKKACGASLPLHEGLEFIKELYATVVESPAVAESTGE